jgi:hypothetical protein
VGFYSCNPDCWDWDGFVFRVRAGPIDFRVGANSFRDQTVDQPYLVLLFGACKEAGLIP